MCRPLLLKGEWEETRLSVLGLFTDAISVALKFHFKNFLGTLPLYSLDKRNDKVVGCLVLIYNLIE